MARTGRPKPELVLSTEEGLALERLANRPKSAQAMAMRARIVLTCAKGGTNRDNARALGPELLSSQAWDRQEYGFEQEERPRRAVEACYYARS